MHVYALPAPCALFFVAVMSIARIQKGTLIFLFNAQSTLSINVNKKK